MKSFNFDRYTSFPTYNAGAVAYVLAGRTAEELATLQNVGMRKAMFRRRVIARELRHFKFDEIGQYFSAVRALLLPGGNRLGADTTSDRMTVPANFAQHRTLAENAAHDKSTREANA